MPSIGEVPAHWEQRTIRAVTKAVAERNRPDLPLLSVYRDYGVILKDSRDDNFNRPSDDLSNYKVVRPGRLVINKMKTWQGSLGISEFEGIVSPAYITCDLRRENEPRYLHFLLRCYPYIFVYNQISYGVRVDQWDMHYEDFKQIPLFLPPLAEQRAIVAFLDRKLVEIDRYIADKEKLITLLQEQKTALINRAVTRGLNPDVKMKPSEVEWLGEVPQHWEVKPLRHLATKFGSGVTPKGGAQVYQESGIPLIRSQNVHFDGLRLDDVAYISPEIHLSMSNSTLCAGDVLLNITGASIGRSCCVPDDLGEANVNQHVCIIRPRAVIRSQYLSHFFSSNFIQTLIWVSSYGAAREGLNLTNLKVLPILVPPMPEQDDILHDIERQTNAIKLAISKAEREIEIMVEYRTALIAEAVTGKMDVRDAG